ncbi:MAG TPA: hypothetical protein VLH75_07700 [Longimicrobiales bacterium]|nr:hypothetical protein [Longimicrobiales bacterium]
MDAWFLGEGVLAPWNDFRVNLLEGKAACFGTSPWDVYLIRTPALMAPPARAPGRRHMRFGHERRCMRGGRT